MRTISVSLITSHLPTSSSSSGLQRNRIEEMGSGLGGYAYRYELWMDDEIMERYVPPERSASKVFFFEFRTEFVVAGDTWGSERFHSSCCSNDASLFTETNLRLCDEYGMTRDEAQSLCLSATDFAQKMETQNPHLAVVPVVVGIEVRTVRQAGESSFDTCLRSIRPESLLPVYITQGVKTGLRRYLLEMPRIRVESWKQASDLMDVCLLCLRGSAIGHRITLLRCKHAFHTQCAVEWLAHSNECPYCNAEEHNLLEGENGRESTLLDGQMRQESRRLIEVQKRDKGQNEMCKMLSGEERKIREMQGSYIGYIGQVETELAKARDDCAKCAGENEDLKIQSESLKEEIRSLKKQLGDARGEVDYLKTEQELAKEEWDEVVDRLEKQVADARGEVVSLMTKLAQAEINGLVRAADLMNEEIRRESEAIWKGLMIFLVIVVVFAVTLYALIKSFSSQNHVPCKVLI